MSYGQKTQLFSSGSDTDYKNLHVMDHWAGALYTLPSCLPELQKTHASMGINQLYIFFGILNRNRLKFKVKKTREILK